jgi:hypothetical protein
MIDNLDGLDREDLDAAALYRADDGWSSKSIEREIAGHRALAQPPHRRVRKPSLESQVRQLWKAS